MLDGYIYDGLRTPFGRHAGKLASVRPDDMVAAVMKTLLQRADIKPEQIEDVILGCACQAGEDSRNIARHALLLAGFPPSTPGMTVNRLCSSGMAAVVDAARAVSCGEGDLYVAGGVESMSRAPFVMSKAESAFSRDFKVFDSSIGARFPNPAITAAYGADTMTETADNVAREFGISREDSDRFALASQARYKAAKDSGFYTDELTPVTVPQGKKPPIVVANDEHPRSDTTLDALARLKSLSPNGVVTAGNASGINDGAAALLVGSLAFGKKYGKKPLARILSSAAVGVEPRIMGVGPVGAIQKALDRAGRTLKEMDVIEINEAFAPQVLGCLKLLEIPFDDSRVNPNGGAIAVGHPLGASGARLALTAVRQLHRLQARFAVASLCIGVGQGLAITLERC
jgi:acetyl-CoA C-acetyltransferase